MTNDSPMKYSDMAIGNAISMLRGSPFYGDEEIDWVREFEQDFVVERTGKFIHILNAVSPGWTASIPFANWVVEKYID